VAFSCDSLWVAAADDEGVAVIWALADNTVVATLDGGSSMLAPSPASAISFSPDGLTCAVGRREGVVTLWSHRDETPSMWGVLRMDELGPLRCLTWSPTGGRLLCGAGPALTLWQPMSEQRLATLDLREHQGADAEAVVGAMFSADGQQVLSAAGCGLSLWDVGDSCGQLIQSAKIFPPGKTITACAEMDAWLAGKSSWGQVILGASDGSLQYWDVTAAFKAFECQPMQQLTHKMGRPMAEVAVMEQEIVERDDKLQRARDVLDSAGVERAAADDRRSAAEKFLQDATIDMNDKVQTLEDITPGYTEALTTFEPLRAEAEEADAAMKEAKSANDEAKAESTKATKEYTAAKKKLDKGTIEQEDLDAALQRADECKQAFTAATKELDAAKSRARKASTEMKKGKKTFDKVLVEFEKAQEAGAGAQAVHKEATTELHDSEVNVVACDAVIVEAQRAWKFRTGVQSLRYEESRRNELAMRVAAFDTKVRLLLEDAAMRRDVYGHSGAVTGVLECCGAIVSSSEDSAYLHLRQKQ